jgi:uncharacterized membrane protein YgdD (TMEM256/DUF423 family)
MRLLVMVAGLCGAAGVALSAVAAHAGGGNVGTAADFLLLHAPAFLAVGLLAAGRWLDVAAAVLFLGLFLFAGDLLSRDYLGTRLFPGAAPAGGVLMIAGWIGIAVSGLLPSRAGSS